MAAAKNITQLLLILSCLLLFPSVFALSDDTLYLIKEINSKGPYYALISGSSTVDEAFFANNQFKLDYETPYVDLSGRRFHVGETNEQPLERRVIYVRSGAGLVNAAATTQQLLDLFNVTGIVHFGIAGSTDNSLNIGDVIIPSKIVNTGLWDWQNPGATIPSYDFAKLDIKDFNVPEEGSNSLGRIGYSPEEVYSNENEVNTPLYVNSFPVYWRWLGDAGLIQNTVLAQCLNATHCLKNKPKVVVGLKGSTSNSYVDNAAYRDFLFQTFGVSSTDTASSAVVMTSLSNGYHAIVVRGLANLAGAEKEGEDYSLYKPLIAKNVAEVVVNLVNVLGTLRVPKSLIRMYE